MTRGMKLMVSGFTLMIIGGGMILLALIAK